MHPITSSLTANNYVVVENFITTEYAARLYEALQNAVVGEPHRFNMQDPQAPGSPSIYNFLPFVDVLLDKCPDISAAYGRRVYPTYVYSRLYKKGAELLRHRDRRSCEVSVTVHLGNDGVEWPFYIKTPQGEEIEVQFKPGMGVIYLGTIAEHWRPKLAGDNYGQVFLHYVDSQGPFAHHLFDRACK